MTVPHLSDNIKTESLICLLYILFRMMYVWLDTCTSIGHRGVVTLPIKLCRSLWSSFCEEETMSRFCCLRARQPEPTRGSSQSPMKTNCWARPFPLLLKDYLQPCLKVKTSNLPQSHTRTQHVLPSCPEDSPSFLCIANCLSDLNVCLIIYLSTDAFKSCPTLSHSQFVNILCGS